MPFDVYAFADYSGSYALRQQRKHIVLATLDRPSTEVSVTQGLSRLELWLEMCLLLERATERGQRVLFGFDHSYSFPMGFYEALSQQPLAKWRDLLAWLAEEHTAIPALGEPITVELYEHLSKVYRWHSVARSTLAWISDQVRFTVPPRLWANAVNERFASILPDYAGGPFWGPMFEPQPIKPTFPFSHNLGEMRLTEITCRTMTQKNMKSIYQLGGNGSVGLQSLYGIGYLHQLLSWTSRHDIRVFCWPFDGFEPPSDSHVLVEVYPTLYNPRHRSDEEDAVACVTWAAQHDSSSALFTKPEFLGHDQLRVTALEGWVLGVGQ